MTDRPLHPLLKDVLSVSVDNAVADLMKRMKAGALSLPGPLTMAEWPGMLPEYPGQSIDERLSGELPRRVFFDFAMPKFDFPAVNYDYFANEFKQSYAAGQRVRAEEKEAEIVFSSPLTLDECLHVARRLTYKPSYSIDYYEWTDSRDKAVLLMVNVRRYENDADAQGNKQEFVSRQPVKWPQTVDELLRLTYGVVQWAELHETAEFMRYRGQRVVAPHPEKTNQPVARFKGLDQYKLVRFGKGFERAARKRKSGP